MVKHTKTIRQLLPTVWVFDHFVGLALKGLKSEVKSWNTLWQLQVSHSQPNFIEYWFFRSKVFVVIFVLKQRKLIHQDFCQIYPNRNAPLLTPKQTTFLLTEAKFFLQECLVMEKVPTNKIYLTIENWIKTVQNFSFADNQVVFRLKELVLI